MHVIDDTYGQYTAKKTAGRICPSHPPPPPLSPTITVPVMTRHRSKHGVCYHTPYGDYSDTLTLGLMATGDA
jgi:hypothetical protein